MIVNNYVQFNNQEIKVEEIAKKAKEQLKDMGYLVKDIKKMDIYSVIDEAVAYCVVNDGEANLEVHFDTLV